jgi:hypothetical protein
VRREYDSNEHCYFEVGNGSRRTLRRVPEMMDTPPIQNNNAFIICKNSDIPSAGSYRLIAAYFSPRLCFLGVISCNRIEIRLQKLSKKESFCTEMQKLDCFNKRNAGHC